jgi:hypothetical protein
VVALGWRSARARVLGAPARGLRTEEEWANVAGRGLPPRPRRHPGAANAPYPYRSPVISRSFVRLCRADTRRTVPDRARITIDSVVAVEPS